MTYDEWAAEVRRIMAEGVAAGDWRQTEYDESYAREMYDMGETPVSAAYILSDHE